MRFFLPLERKKVLELFIEAIESKGLHNAVNIEEDAEKILIKVTKLGTSSFIFVENRVSGGSAFELEKENVAFAHRAFRKNIFADLEEIIIKHGGKFLD